MTAIFITLKCLLVLFIILLIFLILFIFIPFNYSCLGTINENIELIGEIKFLLGLIKISVRLKNLKLKLILNIGFLKFNFSNIANKKVSNKTKISKQKTHYSINNSINIISSHYNILKKIIKIVKPNYFNVICHFGFSDPSITGKLTAFFNTFIHTRNINLIPIFDEEVIDFRAKLTGNIKVYLICWVLINSFFKNKFSKVFKKENIIEKKECIN